MRLDFINKILPHKKKKNQTEEYGPCMTYKHNLKYINPKRQA